MQIHESAENYLETVLMLSERLTHVRSIDIVNELGFSKPSVSVAMKHLREDGYVNMDSDGYITLTDAGMAIASKIYERHIILSRILMKIGVSEKTAVDDACRVEHDLSVETFDAIRQAALRMGITAEETEE